MAQIENYTAAAELWEQEVSHSNPKMRARACHNLAIAHELSGDLVKAVHWAEKALENHNGKPSAQYLESLKARQATEERVREQLAFNDFSK